MLELDDIKKMHDRAYEANQVTREQASNDLIFYWVTQWDDQLLNDSQLQYRGEFNILRKAGRDVMAGLRSNPVQPDFHPKDEDRKDDAELMDTVYRAADRKLSSQEAYDSASQDAIVCGYGAWKLGTEYQTNQIGDNNQVITREYIPEANNTCFWDPNDSTLDKRNAKFVSTLKSYSEEGYKDLVEDLTGDRPENVMESFAEPEQSYVFPWTSQDLDIYITEFYHREKVKDKVLTLEDPLGEPIFLRESQIEDNMDELSSAGFRVVNEKDIERWEVTQYIASGKEILSSQVIAGEFIPVVPVYGEHVSQIEGNEYWEGITRLAKDPQRLRNFQMSYLTDIVARSPRPKPIFWADQLQGLESMYDESGADNNFPYLLQNRFDASGRELPIGPVAQMPEQTMPQALAVSIELSRQAVEDVANPGIPQDIADPDLSGKAVLALQNKLDQQNFIHQENLKFAKRRDAEIFASIASEIVDTPRSVTTQSKDGTVKQVQMMTSVMDKETGEIKVLNDLTNLELEVYADIGTSYESQKQQTLDQLGTMITGMAPGDPMREMLTYKMLEIMPGVNFDDVRQYIRNQQIIRGWKEPETEEEMQMMQQQAQAAQQPDPAMLLGQAEILKGQAAAMREQTNQAKLQADFQKNTVDAQIDGFNAETNRMKVQVDAQKVGADINFTNIKAFGQQIDNAEKSANAFRARLVG